MNELAVTFEQGAHRLAIGVDTEELIKAGVSENTLQAHQRALDGLAVWLDRELNDAVMAEYITEIRQLGKSPATIRQVIATVKWTAENHGKDYAVRSMTIRTMSTIRRERKYV